MAKLRRTRSWPTCTDASRRTIRRYMIAARARPGAKAVKPTFVSEPRVNIRRRLRWLGLIVAAWACLAPLAHVMELPNKLRLDGPLWLGVQQHLYSGWGPAIGAPAEIGGLIISVALAGLHGKSRPAMLLYSVAAI